MYVVREVPEFGFTYEGRKTVVWDKESTNSPYCNGILSPTVAEIMEAARKEFPGIPLDQLEIDAIGTTFDSCDCIILVVKK
jgi:hypothetical protein